MAKPFALLLTHHSHHLVPLAAAVGRPDHFKVLPARESSHLEEIQCVAHGEICCVAGRHYRVKSEIVERLAGLETVRAPPCAAELHSLASGLQTAVGGTAPTP